MTLEVAVGSEPPGKQADVSKLAHSRVLVPACVRLLSRWHVWPSIGPHGVQVWPCSDLSVAFPVGPGDWETSEKAIWAVAGQDFPRGLYSEE